MFSVENGTVFEVEEVDTGIQNAVIKKWYGKEMKLEKVEEGNTRIYKWVKFDLDNGDYVDDITNTDLINVDGVDYTPVDGRVETDITEELKEKKLEELKNQYLQLIRDARDLGEDAEVTRLQQEYQQKKTEIENA
ncbi:hypothetical protein FQB35_10355 [Crassaminicella thermophila]|uniref:Uncharacterized protein n=1 Tax=Crassaminicella thermophila TaxID=2599308 RepID=A0A5C0SEW3_CRATE|nr:hypothetical protein [Crassaminicella thermophila]QEK12568.1 hypothetical protein FQB35_09650 [Crassaminicella thermophila]QEK12700.1 hypothetical protein FQB35_10355 [Crassaminicella thermophila]